MDVTIVRRVLIMNVNDSIKEIKEVFCNAFCNKELCRNDCIVHNMKKNPQVRFGAYLEKDG